MFRMRKSVISIIFIVLLVLFSSGCTSSDSEESVTVDEPNPEAKNVVIIESEGNSTSIGSYFIEGVAKNNNEFGVAYVEVNATGFDDKGNVVSQNSAYVADYDMDAGAESKFYFYLDDPDSKIVKYEISVLDADKSLYKFESELGSARFPLVLPDGMKVSCPNCGSFDNVITGEEKVKEKYLDSFSCNNCGYIWDEIFSYPAEGETIKK